MACNLVTGGFGFIGSYLARELITKGEKVVIGYNTSAGSKLLDSFKGQFQAVRCNVADWTQLVDIIKTNRIDNIYHIGSVLPPVSEENLALAYDVNITGTFNMLEAARSLGVGSVIYISSIGVYGRGAPPVVGDDIVQMPETMYGVTKVCSERLGEQYHRKYGVNFRGVRLPPTVGVGRKPGQASYYICQMVQEPALGRQCTVAVTPETKIPAIYVKDAVGAMIMLKEAGESGLKRRVYNLHGFTSSASELAGTVLKYVPKAKINYNPKPGAGLPKSLPERLDDARAREEWGWKPEYDLDKAVEDFIKELKKINP